MARNITDAQRQITVPFPAKKVNWKRLILWIVLACVVVGGSVGGYYLYDQVTSTVEIPKPPVQSGVVASATPTETSPATQPETPMPPQNLEVEWQNINLPPLGRGFDQLCGLVIENNGNTISVYRAVGPAEGGTTTLYSYWKSEDSGNTWKEIEDVIISGDPPGALVPSEGESWGGDPHNPYFTEDQEEMRQAVDPLESFGKPWRTNQDDNNIFVVVQYMLSDGSKFRTHLEDPMTFVSRLFLSTNKGETWWQVNFPSWFVPYDAYPETLVLTLLRSAAPLPVNAIAVASSGDNLKLFIASFYSERTFWIATIKSPN